MIGTSLGPYKIIEQIGAGGMGEVYLGEDTRLGRKVAIKVLPSEFASDPERLARFEQEARAAAALNHPHIAVIHDVGSESGEDGATTHFMVQEYLEGQSLRERLEKGAPPLDKALDLATEVGEALIAAHKAGIIHRDLKPDNIFVTEEGHAKVLDFGLAKLTEMAAPAGSQASMSPTMLGTVAGQVMGTAGYMAPEQVNGEEVDRRADLFAFGAVLYEMATGRRAFAGESVVQTLSKIAHEEPEAVSQVVETSPAELARIVRKCLAKKRDRRYQDADDLAVDLRQLQDDMAAGVAVPAGYGDATVPADETARLATRSLLPWIAATVVVSAAIASGAIWSLMRPGPERAAHLSILLPEQSSLRENRAALAVSPDGREIVYASRGRLYLRRLDQREPVLLAEEASTPFFSPDGLWLGFASRGQLTKVLLGQGSAPVTISTIASIPLGVSWGSANRILFGGNAVYQVFSEGGGAREVLIVLEDGERALLPEFLPDGETVIFTHMSTTSSGEEEYRIVAQSAAAARRVLIDDGTNARYLPTGHLAFLRAGTLHAVPFDADNVAVTGPPVPLVEGVSVAAAIGVAQFGVSRDGLLVDAPDDDAADRREPVWIDRSGSETAIDVDPDVYRYWKLSPDGRRLAVRMSDPATGNADVYVLDLVRGTRTRLTFDPAVESYPFWLPDGESLVFSNFSRGAGRGFYHILADGTGTPERIAGAGDGLFHAQGWSTDAQTLLYEVRGDLFMVGVDGQAAPKPLIQDRFRVRQAALSPDGRWLAYDSDESGRSEIYVRPFPDVQTDRNQVSTDGGAVPRWNPEGGELFYVSDDGRRLISVSVETAPDFTIAAQTVLFEGDYFSDFYDVAPDGQRFLVMKRTAGLSQLHVIQNWFEEVKRRVPTGR